MTTPEFEYNQNIPKVNDDLATSQGGFLSNFQQLYDAFAQNHVALDGGSTAGNHTIVELLNSLTGFQTDAGELSLYASPVVDQSGQLFMRYQGNTKDVQITNYQLYELNQVAGRAQFFTVLPGKIMIYYGIVFIPGYPFILDLEPPIAKNIISVNLCPGQTPSFPPIATPVTASNGFIKQINLVTPLSLPIKNELIFYFIMVNI
jgi:hypothetical protein